MPSLTTATPSSVPQNFSDFDYTRIAASREHKKNTQIRIVHFRLKLNKVRHKNDAISLATVAISALTHWTHCCAMCIAGRWSSACSFWWMPHSFTELNYVRKWNLRHRRLSNGNAIIKPMCSQSCISVNDAIYGLSTSENKNVCNSGICICWKWKISFTKT